MSVSKPLRPRIPLAFMPPDWNAKAFPPHLPSFPLSPLVETFEKEMPTSPSNPKFSPPTVRSTTAPASNFYSSHSSLTAPPSALLPRDRDGEINTAKFIKTNLRELRSRQVAIRSTNEAQVPGDTPPALLTSPSEPTISQPPMYLAPSLRSFTAPPSDIFVSSHASPPLSSAKSATHSLRSIRNTLRAQKERQAAIRKENEKLQKAAEEASRALAEQHKNEMIIICKIEEMTYKWRWEKLQERAEDAQRDGSVRVTIRFCQIPWPIITPIVHSSVEISTCSVERFLLSPFHKPHLTSREKLEEESVRWEREVFEQRVLRIVRETHRENVRKGGENVRTALKDLLEQLR